jgi:hypothetical protein
MFQELAGFISMHFPVFQGLDKKLIMDGFGCEKVLKDC